MLRRILWSSFVLAAIAPGLAHAQWLQENPHQDGTSVLSGITVISGWKCDPGQITFSVDGGGPIAMASGTGRGDTAAVCGNAGNNGYGALWNVALFGDGMHTAEFFDDGVKFTEADFEVVRLGTNFSLGLDRAFDLPNFPMPGETSRLAWVEGLQNFIITEYAPLPLQLPNLLPKRQQYFSGTHYDFCQSPKPSGPGLLVIVYNEGNGAAGESVLRVDFGAYGSADVNVPSLWPGVEFETVVDFPAGCFDSDCDFTISVDHEDAVDEWNEGDNEVSTLCLG